MSTSNLSAEAEEVLLTSVFAPVFFQKLASYGVAPSNQAEALQLLTLADKLRYSDEVVQHKQANQQASLVGRATQYLDKQLGLADAGYDAAVKEAAAHFLNAPEVKDAALVYQAAFAQSAV